MKYEFKTVPWNKFAWGWFGSIGVKQPKLEKFLAQESERGWEFVQLFGLPVTTWSSSLLIFRRPIS